MATIIIGDVHGCIEELKQLLQKVTSGVDKVDEVIFAGDLMDKGPDSVSVLRYVKELDERLNVTVVEGNHENKNFRFWKKMEAGDPDRAMEMKGAEELSGIMAKADNSLRNWIRDKVVPYVVRPQLKLVVVHGGITPTVAELPEDPSALGGKNKKRVLRSMYIRYIDSEGVMIPFGKERSGDKFWGEVYDGRFGHVYFGHQPWLKAGPEYFEHATGIDLGCVHGGNLCAAIIRGPLLAQREFVTVQADKEYCPPIELN